MPCTAVYAAAAAAGTLPFWADIVLLAPLGMTLLSYGLACSRTRIHFGTPSLTVVFSPLDDGDAVPGQGPPHPRRERLAPERPRPARHNDRREKERGDDHRNLIPHQPTRVHPDQDQHR